MTKQYSSHNVHVPGVTGLASNSFFYQGTLDWNSLPVNIRSITNKNSFKSHVKAHLATTSMNQELAVYA